MFLFAEFFLGRCARSPRTDPENLWYPTPDERASLLRAVLGRLRRSDPFPALQGQGYLDAFSPWFRGGGLCEAHRAEEESCSIGSFP